MYRSVQDRGQGMMQAGEGPGRQCRETWLSVSYPFLDRVACCRRRLAQVVSLTLTLFNGELRKGFLWVVGVESRCAVRGRDGLLPKSKRGR